MFLGVIADDFTGATDIASFLVENGVTAIQMNGVPAQDTVLNSEAVVISLKIRSCPPEQAISEALAALQWLKGQQCQHYYFKYCSTFDSTAQGNIGPVTDALLQALEQSFTVISPALPVNGRTVYQGYLFVMQQLLAESGMRSHPINPMTDSYLPRLMEAQATGRCQVIGLATIRQGVSATRQALCQARQAGYRYVVLDAISEDDLRIQGEAVSDLPLLTGGSGLGAGLAAFYRQCQQDSEPVRAVTKGSVWPDFALQASKLEVSRLEGSRLEGSRLQSPKPQSTKPQASQAGYPLPGAAVVLSGSCSLMTNQQVNTYRQQAPAHELDVQRCLHQAERDSYAQQLAQWVLQQPQHPQTLAPLVYATQPADQLAITQQRYGTQAVSLAVEQLFAQLARLLAEQGICRFIVAGGETSGAVTAALAIRGFHIGPCISPGVPWVRATDSAISLALKSGNFGDEQFFARAQQEFAV